MAEVLFDFILVVFFHWAPEQSTGPAPAVEKDSILEWLITGSYDQRVVFAGCVWIRFTPVEHQSLGFEFYQFRADILGPMPAPPALSQADIVEEYRKLRVENDTIFFFEPARGRMGSV